MTLVERAEEIFVEIAEAPASHRETLLRERCDGDPSLREEVESLLRHHDGTAAFLDPAEVRRVVAPAPIAITPGQRLGSYTILALLGSGGMADVYLARQQKPQRTVALKIVRRAIAGPSNLRRFEREAELLGRLLHPGIAQVYEAGTADPEGVFNRPQPFMAMELVPGPPLTRYAEQHSLDVRARVELIIKVCEAMEHAHQRGVIHRDLKPGNVLVDEHGQPKVLDFGVALVLDADRDITRHTHEGQLVGTLPYMSPEQVGGDPDEIDTRCDVYALGVMLFELLTGQLPHGLGATSIPEAIRLIREGPTPRLSSIDRNLRGDLDTVAATALEKDKSRRYQSPAALADDLRRYLAGHPIAARDASTLELLSKRLRRYRGIVAGAAAAVIAMTAVSTWAWRASVRSERLASDLGERLSAANIERGRMFGREGNLAAAERLLWPEHLAKERPATTWALWELYARHPQLAVFMAHEDGLRDVRWSRSGDRLITASPSGHVSIWEAGSRRRVRSFDARVGPILQLAVNTAGTWVGVAGAEGVALWMLEREAEPILALSGERMRSIAFHPSRDWIMVGAEDGNLHILDPIGGVVRKERIHAALIRAIRFSPDGSRYATLSEDQSVRIWTEDASRELRRFRHAPSAEAIAFSNDGRLLACGGREPHITIHDLETGLDRELTAPSGSVGYLGFLPDGKLISCSWWSLDIWDLVTGSRRSIGAEGSWGAIEISPDGNVLAVGETKGRVRLVEMNSPGVRVLGSQTGRVAAGVSPDGTLVASGDEAGIMLLRQVKGGSIVHQLASHASRVRAVHFSPDGRRLATAAADGVVRVTDLTDWSTFDIAPRTLQSAGSIAWTPDGRRLITVSPRNEIETIDVASREVVDRRACSREQVVSVSVSPDGHTLAAASRDLRVYIWRQGSPAPIAVSTHPGTPWTCSFSADGSRLVAGDWVRQVNLIDVNAGAMTSRFLQHNALVSDVAFRPGSNDFAASASRDGLVQLWDMTAGTPVARIEALGDSETFTLSFSRDGGVLAIGGTNGRVAVADLSHYMRHIQGNLAYQQSQHEAPIAAEGARTTIK